MPSETVHSHYQGAIRESGKTLYSCINANLRFPWMRPNLNGLFYLDGSKPPASPGSDGDVFDGTLYGTALVKTHPADFGKKDPAAFNLNPLGKTDPLSPAFLFENRQAL